MKTLNLNILHKFILVFCLSLVAISCSNDNLDFEESQVVMNEQKKSSKEINESDFRFKPIQFNDIGVKHNKALERLYQKLKENKENNIFTITDGKTLSNFLKKELSKPQDYYEANNTNLELLNNSIDNGLKISAEIREISDLKINNEKVKNYLFSLEDIIRSGRNVISRIKDLENNIEKDLTLSNKDLYVLFSATRVGESSFRYWSKESNSWLQNLNTPRGIVNVQNRVSSNNDCSWLEFSGPNSCIGQLASTIAVADIIGAVAGAIGAAAVNFVIGPGQVAYAVAILGTGVSTSAAAGMYWLLEN
ncbi:hypothetical protein [Aquimarina sp. 2201CG5-10]|uniref:hypothetical protein n=1 Tax=Aquimarina callyspongiae TaxID=3098150 RepID=UPI002AB41B2F|nr:hypothetical protein [Aquimarina sp. 2201CG5-10]MDY8135726.1 hypothetical protein [Aquimarina sp. 2201CG5-10]